jgi:hypothetical protein
VATDSYYSASWGGLRLWIASLRYPAGRDVVVHEPSSGGGFVTQDRGPTLRRASMSLLFASFPGETKSGVERVRALEALASDGEPHIFTHPIHGSYLARIADLSIDLDSEGPPTATCDLIPTEPVAAVTAIGGGGIVDPWGTSGIDAAADDLDAELANLWLSNVPGDARAAAATWDEGDASSRDVLVTVERITSTISDEIEGHEMDADIALWSALKAYVLLGDALRTGAIATSGSSATTITMLLGETTSLRPLLAAVYGASEVESRYAEALELNDIRAPGRIPAGTMLTLAAPPARPRSA